MGGVAGPGACIHMITCVCIYIYIYIYGIRISSVIWFSGSRVPIAVRNGRGLRGARETARLVSQQQRGKHMKTDKNLTKSGTEPRRSGGESRDHGPREQEISTKIGRNYRCESRQQ